LSLDIDIYDRNVNLFCSREKNSSFQIFYRSKDRISKATKKIPDSHSNDGLILDYQHSYGFGRLHDAPAPGESMAEVSVDEMVDTLQPDKPRR
jgi:hypothetical protein